MHCVRTAAVIALAFVVLAAGAGADAAATGDVAAATAAASPGQPNYQGLWWNAPAGSESGWGINFAHQGDTIFATWFTYDTSGKAAWFAMTAQKIGAETYGGKLYATRGPAFNAEPFDPKAVVATEVGTGTLSFSDADNGTFNYAIGAVNQTKAITREVFGQLPTCTFGAAAATGDVDSNYQDMWWNSPAGSEPGWGIALSHSTPNWASTIVAVWLTYDLDGSSMWLIATGPYDNGMFNGYNGTLYRTSGARFDAFDAHNVVTTAVGEMSLYGSWNDGNTRLFDYSVQLPGMASAVSGTKTLTRQIFVAPGTTCR